MLQIFYKAYRGLSRNLLSVMAGVFIYLLFILFLWSMEFTGNNALLSRLSFFMTQTLGTPPPWQSIFTLLNYPYVVPYDIPIPIILGGVYFALFTTILKSYINFDSKLKSTSSCQKRIMIGAFIFSLTSLICCLTAPICNFVFWGISILGISYFDNFLLSAFWLVVLFFIASIFQGLFCFMLYLRFIRHHQKF